MLTTPSAFFDRVRALDLLGPVLTASEVAGCEHKLAAFGVAGWGIGWAAYGLATSYHETGHSMQPIREWGGPEYLRRNYDITGRRPEEARRMGNTEPGDGIRYAGRGDVQLTWKKNYQRAELQLGEPLVANPDLALRPDLSARIMVEGMARGWFTTRRLDHYAPQNAGRLGHDVYRRMRAIINGRDKADLIAANALAFEEALVGGGWAV
jgi:putative chitinase